MVLSVEVYYYKEKNIANFKRSFFRHSKKYLWSIFYYLLKISDLSNLLYSISSLGSAISKSKSAKFLILPFGIIIHNIKIMLQPFWCMFYIGAGMCGKQLIFHSLGGEEILGVDNDFLLFEESSCV